MCINRALRFSHLFMKFTFSLIDSVDKAVYWQLLKKIFKICYIKRIIDNKMVYNSNMRVSNLYIFEYPENNENGGKWDGILIRYRVFIYVCKMLLRFQISDCILNDEIPGRYQIQLLLN